jgi:methylmalonyl-CoA/ethylmalonyl-CoA epimerase
MIADLRFHHTGILVRDIEASCREWVSRWCCRIESQVVHDPIQTANVQFLRQPGARQWIELICPDSPESKLAQAARKQPGLHHLCFESDDIESDLRAFSESGMLVVATPVPAVAFGGRRIAWLMGQDRVLTELVEDGPGPLRLSQL